MSISIAKSSPTAYNEPVVSESLFPLYVSEAGYEIVRLIKLYYDYLNSENQPSQEIARIIQNHDIDEMSDKYLSAIQLQIAKSVPESVVLDKKRLYKIIYQYYKERGSDHSVQSFFRLFFNEFVTVFYPSTRLFNTSGDKSETSSIHVLQDGKYWQNFSYEIRTANDPSVWKESFLKFIHPAGLKLFLAILVVMYSSNIWEGSLSDYIVDIENTSPEDFWRNIKLDQLLYKHSPKFQANSYYAVDYLFKVLLENTHHYRNQTYSVSGVDDADLYAAAFLLNLELTLRHETASSQFRSSYQTWLKFYDTAAVSDGYNEYTIEKSMETFYDVNENRFECLSTSIQPTDLYYLDSYIDTTDVGDLPANYNSSSYSEDDSEFTYPIKPGYLPDTFVY